MFIETQKAPLSFPAFSSHHSANSLASIFYHMHGEQTAQATLGIVALFTEKTGLLRVTGFVKESSSRKKFQVSLLRAEQRVGGCSNSLEKVTGLRVPSWQQLSCRERGISCTIFSLSSRELSCFVLAVTQARTLVTGPVLGGSVSAVRDRDISLKLPCSVIKH